MTDALSVGVGSASGCDAGNSTSTILIDEPALLGMLKEGPQGFGMAAGASVKAEAVLEAGVSVLFHNSNCLNKARRSGSIFLGMVMVSLAALSCRVKVWSEVDGRSEGSREHNYGKQGS